MVEKLRQSNMYVMFWILFNCFYEMRYSFSYELNVTAGLWIWIQEDDVFQLKNCVMHILLTIDMFIIWLQLKMILNCGDN